MNRTTTQQTTISTLQNFLAYYVLRHECLQIHMLKVSCKQNIMKLCIILCGHQDVHLDCKAKYLHTHRDVYIS